MTNLNINTRDRTNNIRKDHQGNSYLQVDGGTIVLTLNEKTGEITRTVLGDAYMYDTAETMTQELNAYAALVNFWLKK